MIEWFENKSVAVVGNAKSIFDKNLGSFIDSHDVVCRINQGLIIVDKMHQGEKTDVFGFAGLKKFSHLLEKSNTDKNIFLSSRKTEEAKLIPNLILYPLEWYIELKKNLKNLDGSADVNSPLMIGEKGESDKPSAGICLLDYISRMVPKSVSVFGFDWKESPTFYNQGGFNKSHNWSNEKKYCLENLKKNNNWQFY
jgi:hypothetical protein